MAKKLTFTGTVGATFNPFSAHVGAANAEGVYPVAGVKLVNKLVEMLAVNGWQAFISEVAGGVLTITDRDNPQFSGKLKLNELGYPSVSGNIWGEETTNPNANAAVLKQKV